MSKESDIQEFIGSVFASSNNLAKGSSLHSMIQKKRTSNNKVTPDKEDAVEQRVAETDSKSEDRAADQSPDVVKTVDEPKTVDNAVDTEVTVGEKVDDVSAVSVNSVDESQVDGGSADSPSEVKDLAASRFDRYFEVNEVEFDKALNVSGYIVNDISILVRMTNRCSIQVFFDNFVKDWLFTNQEFFDKLGLSDFIDVQDNYKIYPKKAHCEYELSDLKKRCYEYRGKVNTCVRVSSCIFDKMRILSTFTKIPVVYYLQLAYNEFFIKNRKALERQKYFVLLGGCELLSKL